MDFDAGKDLREGKVGTWSESGGLSIPTPELFERRKNLSGVTLRNSMMAWEPVYFSIKSSDGTAVHHDGLMNDIILMITEVKA